MHFVGVRSSYISFLPQKYIAYESISIIEARGLRLLMESSALMKEVFHSSRTNSVIYEEYDEVEVSIVLHSSNQDISEEIVLSMPPPLFAIQPAFPPLNVYTIGGKNVKKHNNALILNKVLGTLFRERVGMSHPIIRLLKSFNYILDYYKLPLPLDSSHDLSLNVLRTNHRIFMQCNTVIENEGWDTKSLVYTYMGHISEEVPESIKELQELIYKELTGYKVSIYDDYSVYTGQMKEALVLEHNHTDIEKVFTIDISILFSKDGTSFNAPIKKTDCDLDTFRVLGNFIFFNFDILIENIIKTVPVKVYNYLVQKPKINVEFSDKTSIELSEVSRDFLLYKEKERSLVRFFFIKFILYKAKIDDVLVGKTTFYFFISLNSNKINYHNYYFEAKGNKIENSWFIDLLKRGEVVINYQDDYYVLLEK